MDYRHLGGSGMLVSAIAYGNWVTHGSQDELVRRVDKILDPVVERDPERIDVFVERP
ncbi:hypothetical protein OG819_16850 [Streptomyces sp. NBC_01549]|uniref:hypothetical protein n=1 Tax=Streptomyces sp. NBC_01549 TaxID=2975874 RepID=UPI002256B255|nr:hypothetical protein [Streptomyces sp. NBC_01549]MCX4591348.1 hypothetical protein [Streptomyces sp. NBC_01549]